MDTSSTYLINDSEYYVTALMAFVLVWNWHETLDSRPSKGLGSMILYDSPS